MYKTYFHSNIIDKAIKSDEYTSNDWDSYLFRLLNLTNENRRLDAVKDLDKIYNILFVENHPSTIKDTKSAFKIAVGIYHIILDNLKDGIEETNEDTGEVTTKPASESNSEENSESESGGGKSESKELSDEEFEGLKKAVEDGDIGSGGSSEGSEIVLSEAQKKSLEKAFDKQKDFVNGKTKKSKLAKKWASEINAVEESGMRLTDVGGKELGEYDWRTDSQGNGMSKCVVIDKITDGLLENDLCEVLRKNYYSSEDREKVVVEGLRLGTMLGKKLKVRNESRDTKWTRKDSGRIDKRLIAELGFGNERVFSTTFTDSYADAHLHISIDASGSMGGDKWDNTIKATVAICKAASMIQGLSVEVSVRYTTYNRGSRRNDEMPAILMAYDSRKNKMAHIKKYFKYMRVCGTTPEGLCYQAIMDKISSGSNDKESYFLNFSDGMPMFSNATIRYYSTQAVKHTKKMMKEIRNKGVSVLSYYIGGDYERSSNSEDFISMYGSDAKFIDVTSVGAVAKTMNKKFLAK
jgi:nitric oxide reductase activation protein